MREHWRPLLVFAVVEIIGPWALLSDAERVLDSSLTGLLVAAVPIIAVVAGRLAGDRERLGPLRWTGLGLGLAGVALLAAPHLDRGSGFAIGEVLLVAVGYAVGPIIAARRLGEVPNLLMTATCLSFAALVYLVPAVLTRPAALPAPEVLLALGGLGLLCTAAAFVLFFELIGEVGPTRAVVFTYVNPAVAVAAGVLRARRAADRTVIAGLALILLGARSCRATARFSRWIAGHERAQVGFRTRAVHAGAVPDAATGARAVPIYQTQLRLRGTADAASLFALQKYGLIYSRIANPTVAVLGAAGELEVRMRGGDDGAGVPHVRLPRGRGRPHRGPPGSTAARSPSSTSRCAASGWTPPFVAGREADVAAAITGHQAGVHRGDAQPSGAVADLAGLAEVAGAGAAGGDATMATPTCAARSSTAPTSSSTRPPSSSAATAPRWAGWSSSRAGSTGATAASRR